MGVRALDDLEEPAEHCSRPIDQRTAGGAVGEQGAHPGDGGPEANQS